MPQVSTKLTGIEPALGQVMQSVFDTIVLVLILVKSRISGGGGILSFIVKQGLAYYVMSIAMYFTWTLMILFAPASKKYVMGGPASGLVCVSVNRLTLYLRSYMLDFDPGPGERTLTTFDASVAPRRRGSWLDARNLERFGGYGSSSFEIRDKKEGEE